MSTLQEFLNGPYGWVSIFVIIIVFTGITIIFYLRKDKYDPEPVSRIIWAFLLGLLSVFPALILSLLGIILIGNSAIISSVIIAPPAEELAKGWMVIYLARHEEFDGPLDGLIYGAMVGAGFAAAENLLYGFASLFAESIFDGLVVSVIRSISQIIGHPFYTGLFGVGVGEAKVGLAESKYNRIWQSIILHAFWNLSANLASPFFFIGLLVVIGTSIYILRKELKEAIRLDREAYERGYYKQKQRFLEQKKQRLKQQLRGGWQQQRGQQQNKASWEQPPQQNRWQNNQHPSQNKASWEQRQSQAGSNNSTSPDRQPSGQRFQPEKWGGQPDWYQQNSPQKNWDGQNDDKMADKKEENDEDDKKG